VETIAATVPLTDTVVRLPLLIKQVPTIFFADDFEGGIGAWTPFLNYWRLKPEQWYWGVGQGYNGGNGYLVDGGRGGGDGAHDVVSMVLAPGSDQWANYRYKIRFNSTGGRSVGLWFRGAYKAGQPSAQWLTGYYFTVDVRSDEAVLSQLRTDIEHGDDPDPNAWYSYSNPMRLAGVDLATDLGRDEWHQLMVEVVGARIKCYLDDQLLIDFTDSEGSIFLNGTVGLYGYGNCGAGTCAKIKFDDAVVEPIY
jgi:hypothetical protein